MLHAVNNDIFNPENRDWPADKIIKIMIHADKLDIELRGITLSKKSFDELQRQLGSKFNGIIHGPKSSLTVTSEE
jgi:hypothetical protein